MNEQEAKLILSAYRPSGRDAQDPDFAEALKLAASSPELKEWFKSECAVDESIALKLREAAVPDSLKLLILAGRPIVQPMPWWSRRNWLAAAAVLVFILGLSLFLRPTPQRDSLDAFRADMTRSLDGGLVLNQRSTNIQELRGWLNANWQHGSIDVPAGLVTGPGVGCAVLMWKGKPVSLVCLRSDTNGVVHLFAINSSDLADPPPAQPRRATIGGWATAAWTRGDKCYLLAGPPECAAVRDAL